MSGRAPGRPLNPEHDEAIFAATVAIVTEAGFDAVNIGTVARHAGVSRPTIYRRFQNTQALLEACIAHIVDTQLVAPAAYPDPREQIIELLSNTVDMLTNTAIGVMFRASLSQLEHNTELTVLISRFGASRRQALNKALSAAQRQGMLSATASIPVVGDALVGAVYFRYLLTNRRLDRRYLEALYDNVCGDPANPE
ncbi:MAG: TetR/AcrR family transcriptional regulator [Pseudomonadota bacterium]